MTQPRHPSEPASASETPSDSPPPPLSEQEERRLNQQTGEDARRQAEVGRTVRGGGA